MMMAMTMTMAMTIPADHLSQAMIEAKASHWNRSIDYRERNGATETPFIEGDVDAGAWKALTTKLSNARATELQPEYSKTGRLQVKMFGFGKKRYFLFTEDNCSIHSFQME